MKIIKDMWKRVFPGDITPHLLAERKRTIAKYRKNLRAAGLNRAEINVIEIIDKIKRTRKVKLTLDIGDKK